MANTKITVTFTKDDNSENSYVHTFDNDASLNRIINAHQTIYGSTNVVGTFLPASNNQARKRMVKWAVENWKLAAKNLEQEEVAIAARATITDIPSTDTSPDE
jgi:hypothetical protein